VVGSVVGIVGFAIIAILKLLILGWLSFGVLDPGRQILERACQNPGFEIKPSLR
jgi:hypothetical protein